MRFNRRKIEEVVIRKVNDMIIEEFGIASFVNELSRNAIKVKIKKDYYLNENVGFRLNGNLLDFFKLKVF